MTNMTPPGRTSEVSAWEQSGGPAGLPSKSETLPGGSPWYSQLPLPLPATPLCSPSSPAPGVCPVPLPASWPPEHCGLRGGHRGGPGGMCRGGPGRGARLPQRLPIPLLGTVPGPATLLPAGCLHLAAVLLPRLLPAVAQSLDSRPHSESPCRSRAKNPLPASPITLPSPYSSSLEPWVNPALPRCWSWP